MQPLKKIYGVSVSAYDPEAVVMRGVHKDTGDVISFNAAEIDARRKDELGFKAKHWDFACPCCGDDARVVHVKSTDKRKAHWRLKDDGWHSNPDCDLHSKAELTLRSKGFRIRRRGETGRLEAKMRLGHGEKNPSETFNQSQKGAKLSRPRGLSVLEIVEMYFDLPQDQRSEIDVRVGKAKVSLDRLCMTDARCLVALMDVGQKDFILPVKPNWEKAEFSGYGGVWDVPCGIEHVPQGESFVEIKPQLKVSGEVLDLYETGRILSTAPLMVHVSSHYSFGSRDSKITACAVVDGRKDFARAKGAVLYATEPGVGGVQTVMPL